MVQNKKQSAKQIEIAQTKQRNVWKILSISMIAIFCVFLLFGLIRVYHFKSAFLQITPEQIKLAETIVNADIDNSGDNISNYDVHINNKVRHSGKKGTANINIVQVSLKKKSVTQLYVIDIDKGMIILHSKTELYGNIVGDDIVGVGSNARLEHPESRHRWDTFKIFRGINNDKK